MTQLVVASTLFGAATAASAVEAGLLGGVDRERVLLVVNNAPIPELTPALDEVTGCEPILDRFSRVVHLTGLIAPTHPSEWKPGDQELPMLERLLRSYWGLGGAPLDLVVESLAVNPARALTRIFHDSPVTVYSDGLMSYGPTRSQIPLSISQRLTELLHLDLVTGLRPVLLSEHNVLTRSIPNDMFRMIIDEVTAKTTNWRMREERPTAVVVGQYLTSLGVLTPFEEAQMHVSMVEAAAARGAEVVHFKPHPSAPPHLLDPVTSAAKQFNVDLQFVRDPVVVETFFSTNPPRMIVGSFSTALLTARTLFGIKSVAVDTGSMLQRLKPYQNSNRIPATIVDALHRETTAYANTGVLQDLISAVAYCMQPERLAFLRQGAVDFLESMQEDERRRYFKLRRLEALALPGGRIPRSKIRTTAARVIRSVERKR